MLNKNPLSLYLETLQPNRFLTPGLIGSKKILNNVKKLEMHLNALNFIQANNIEDLKVRISDLYDSNPECFQAIFILLAVRIDKDSKFTLKDKIVPADEILKDKQKIIDLFIESKLAEVIVNGKIKNFVDYVYGVEVGMDTNARKNRNGKLIEDKTFSKLQDMFKENSNIICEKQKRIKGIDGKVFDIVLTNKQNNKVVLIESSFYNVKGSKISETARSYVNLYDSIISTFEDKKYYFVWLADGDGMNSITNQLEHIYDCGYIYNHKLFFESIKRILE